ncbi:helix-turn-helix domain-containing protein [Kitasatospora sp. NPDC054939]
MPFPPAPTPALVPSARNHFGRRLRHWREARGLSQAELGRRLGYDDSLISRVENARRWPPPDLPARADELLLTGGELTHLWSSVAQQRRRLDQLTAPARPTLAPAPPAAPDPATFEVLGVLLAAYREAATRIGGQDLTAVLEHHTRTLAGWQRAAPRSALGPLRSLAARYAELAGWARFDAGQHARALTWYDCGLDWARECGDHGTAAALLTRRSNVHWSVGDAATALALATAARAAARPLPGSQGWAAVAQAHGYALAGEAGAARRALDDAERLAEAAVRTGERTPWLARAELVLTVAHGTCHRDLAVRTGHRSHARAAVAHLGEALSRLDETFRPPLPVRPEPALPRPRTAASPHDRALVAARLAGAHAWTGRPEAAREALTRVPADATGRVAAEHRQSRTWLARWDTPARPAP